MVLYVFLLIVLICYPLYQYRNQVNSILIHQTNLLNWMKQIDMKSFTKDPENNRSNAESLLTLVSNTAQLYNVALERLQPNIDGSLNVVLKDQVATNFFKFLETLIKEKSLIIENISITFLDEGKLNVRIHFK